jgi:hypothetical protein
MASEVNGDVFLSGCLSPGDYLVAGGEGLISAGLPKIREGARCACSQLDGIAALVLHKEAVAEQCELHFAVFPRKSPSPLSRNNASHLQVICVQTLLQHSANRLGVSLQRLEPQKCSVRLGMTHVLRCGPTHVLRCGSTM